MVAQRTTLDAYHFTPIRHVPSDSRLQPPSRERLFRHLGRQSGYAAVLLIASLAVGMAGYHWVAKLEWVEAFENSAMLLAGMGPTGDVKNQAGKIFAGVFALYAGLVFLVVTALVLAPVIHHVLHRFHWEADRGA